MLSPGCFSPEFITRKREELGKVDPQILEKSIHALALLSHLGQSGLEFVFKGGTSLLLHLPKIRRLSIDIDILCAEAPEKLEKVLGSISKNPPFTGYEEDERGHRGLPKRRHFRFHYRPLTAGNQTPFVLLDVVEESTCELPLIQKPVSVDFIEIEKETLIHLPTPEGLLGDKLTAFAPNTIGVPFENKNGIGQTMQVAKQLFDIGELFNIAGDGEEVAKAYRSSYKTEIEYRENAFSMEEAIEDTKIHCYQFCGLGLKGFRPSTEASNLQDGIRRLQTHLVNYRFTHNIEAKIAAAKAGLIASAIQNAQTGFNISDWLYNPSKVEELKAASLTGDLTPLNRLKKFNPEAFHYWSIL